jgi:predicted enzyme related to lactoylglutathione lyase
MSKPSCIRAVLVLPVSDMRQAREWYASALDFATVYLHNDPAEDPEGNYAILRRDTAEVHVILDEPPREHPWTTAGTGYFFLNVHGLDAIYEQVVSRGVPIHRGIQRESWGARSFQLIDPSGNLILVAEEIGT